MDFKGAWIKVLTALLFVFSFALFVSSCASARQCYTSPCFEGDGLTMLWAVHDGEGFMLVVLSMLCMAHAIVAFTLLFRSSYSSYKYGMLVASSLTLSLLMLGLAASFAVKRRMVNDLDQHANGQEGYFFEQNEVCDKYDRAHAEDSCNGLGHHCLYVDINTDLGSHGCFRAMKANTGVEPRFDGVAALSALLFVVQGLLGVSLLVWRREFDAGADAPAAGGGGGGVDASAYGAYQ